ncbi:4'-phosphopantetheinyl transferase superfamily protein [Micromonospora parva]|uniref:4'-phosphopantetheinyl transferase family protein n=1 Tax=Micromonospora parva TaxID=1464048 RepID=UPI0033EA1FAD
MEAFDDVRPAPLFPEEQALVVRAVEKRRREFATARRCSREALAVLGFPPAPLLPGERGAPQWPAGVVGSITHCAGYRAATVARDSSVWTIGVDAEPNAPLPEGVLETVAGPAERQAVTALLATYPGVRWDRLLFSAKEAVYKAWFPLARRWLGFEDAVVELDAEAGSFEAQLTIPAPRVAGRYLTGFRGGWTVERGLVATAVVLPRE